MITAQPLPPSKVGVAPGTTTFTLGDPRCDRGPRAWIQRFRWRLSPQALVPMQVGPTAPTPVPTAAAPSLARRAIEAARARAEVFSPYPSLVQMRGGLGYVINTAGREGPSPANAREPYAEVLMAMKQGVWQDAYCGRADKQYHTRATPGLYYDTQLGRIPSDLQLSRRWGFTPVVSSWIPFREQTWAPGPWVPRIGTWTPEGLRPVAPPLAGVGNERGLCDADDYVGVTATSPVPIDPAREAVAELKRHQDRVFALSVVSTLAIASTALINIVKHLTERRRERLEPASPTAPVAGTLGPVCIKRSRSTHRCLAWSDGWHARSR